MDMIEYANKLLRDMAAAQLPSAVPPEPPDAKPLAEPITGPDRCPQCHGTGTVEPISYSPGRPWLNTMRSCPTCRGTGKR